MGVRRYTKGDRLQRAQVKALNEACLDLSQLLPLIKIVVARIE